MSSLLDAALTAAGRGWHVIPLKAGMKRPAVPGHTSSHCGGTYDPWCDRGHLGWEPRATTDTGRITEAWSSAEFNVGVACGPSGLVVVDLDVPKPDEDPPAEWAYLDWPNGSTVLYELARAAGGNVPPTYTVRTPSGGRHLYYRAQEGTQFTNTVLGWKIDIRAWGGQVVAAGSVTPKGTYRVVDGREPTPLPRWLAERLQGAARQPEAAPSVRLTGGESKRDRYAQAAVAAEVCLVQKAQAGVRNYTLFHAAKSLGQLVAGGELDESDVITILLNAATGHVDAGAYSLRQAQTTIRSGLSAGANRPRTIRKSSSVDRRTNDQEVA